MTPQFSIIEALTVAAFCWQADGLLLSVAAVVYAAPLVWLWVLNKE